MSYHGSLLVTFEAVFRDVVPPHAIHVTRERGKESAEKDPSFGCYQLIQHAVKVGVNAFDLVLEIIQKYNIIVLEKWFEERFVSLLGNETG